MSSPGNAQLYVLLSALLCALELCMCALCIDESIVVFQLVAVAVANWIVVASPAERDQ